MGCGCCDGVCGKCWGVKYIVVGLILIANQQWFQWSWWLVIGALLVLKGVLKLAMPMGCGHCQTMPAKKGKK